MIIIVTFITVTILGGRRRLCPASDICVHASSVYHCNLTFSSVLIVFYSAIDITSPAETPTVGGTATFTCTSLLGQADTIEWLLVDVIVEMNSAQATLDLVLDPVSESMNGGVYRCRVTIGGATVDRDITVTVQGELKC